MKSGNSTAGDGDEQIGKERAGNDRTAALGKAGHGRKNDHRRHKENAHGQEHDGADLHIGGKIIPRRQQHPHRQNAGEKAVHHQQDDDGLFIQREQLRQGWRIVHGFAQHHRKHQQNYADDRYFAHFARPQLAQIESHQQRNGNGGADGKGAP